MVRLIAFGALGFLVGCGAAGDDTCLETEIEYAGDAMGAVFIKERGVDGGGISRAASVEIALALSGVDPLRGSSSCWGGVRGDEPYEIVAWIDVRGDEEDACSTRAENISERLSDPNCGPDLEDPSGQVSIVVKTGQYNVAKVTIRDP